MGYLFWPNGNCSYRVPKVSTPSSTAAAESNCESPPTPLQEQSVEPVAARADPEDAEDAEDEQDEQDDRRISSAK